MLNLSFSSIFVSSPKLKGLEAGLGDEQRFHSNIQGLGSVVQRRELDLRRGRGKDVFLHQKESRVCKRFYWSRFFCVPGDKTPVSYNPELFALFPARTWAPLPVPQLDWTDSRARSLLTCSGTTSHLCPTALALLPARGPRHWTSRSVRCLNLQVLA